ncbi:C-type lectin domain family 4 member G-like isoform X2 [Ambystoma mexicanum]|uniref:C-type lectin domain family 4 member G-like isoform X2 n=1 Tax=Ambystoma mexicanum TaxID=8296 RepID=UPI0037E73831
MEEDRVYGNLRSSSTANLCSEGNIYDNFSRPRTHEKRKRPGEELGKVCSSDFKDQRGSITEAIPSRPPEPRQESSFTEAAPVRPPKIGLDFSSPAVETAFRPPEAAVKSVPILPRSTATGRKPLVVLSVVLVVSFLICLALVTVALLNNAKLSEELKTFHMGHSETGTHVSSNLSDVMGKHEQYRAKQDNDLQDLQKTVDSQGQNGGKERDKIRTETKKALEDLKQIVSHDRTESKKERDRIQADVKTGLAALRANIDAICEACPPGWERYSKFCYFFSKNAWNWEIARDACINQAAHLVVIGSLQEATFLNAKFKSQQYWIGLSDMKKEGEWVWVDGTTPLFFSWGPHQPDDSNNEDCVIVQPDGHWSDYQCSYNIHWICQKTWTC